MPALSVRPAYPVDEPGAVHKTNPRLSLFENLQRDRIRDLGRRQGAAVDQDLAVDFGLAIEVTSLERVGESLLTFSAAAQLFIFLSI
ncbi:MAG: hypothetical protein ACYCSH_13135 [Acidithiobacillus sp.]